MTMRVFLTGATGYIGSAIAEALKPAGHEVSATARSDEAAGQLEARGFLVQRADLKDPGTLTGPASTAHAVIHAGFVSDITGGDIDRRAVEAMLGAIHRSENPSSILAASGCSVIPATGWSTRRHPPTQHRLSRGGQLLSKPC